MALAAPEEAIAIRLPTLPFASKELIERMEKIEVLSEFVKMRQTEIEKYNEENGFLDDKALNARQQTNLGLFRKYVHYYLDGKPEINSEMSLIIRQLDPTELGVPMEVYCFTKHKAWAAYEGVVGDIFDHLFAVLELFDLKAFERPTGQDLKESLNK